ncbi:hypothetical protein CTRI78_v008555 [Colletotrichum trifolii]|uniref:Uncharacterized protein n=1 Tax=Colletotrichum trifolii TaxID=5466 RepID=A0A4R8QTV5_COLTR|nr:hypothetical protein CTRI78_v008555 [Colletotrichum trifolii]
MPRQQTTPKGGGNIRIRPPRPRNWAAAKTLFRRTSGQEDGEQKICLVVCLLVRPTAPSASGGRRTPESLELDFAQGCGGGYKTDYLECQAVYRPTDPWTTRPRNGHLQCAKLH